MCTKTLLGAQLYVKFIYILKNVMSVYLFVCMLPIAGRTAGPIKTKLGIWTHVDPGSVLVKVKVKVMWCHLVNANETPYRARKGRENSSANRDKHGRLRPAGPRQ